MHGKRANRRASSGWRTAYRGRLTTDLPDPENELFRRIQNCLDYCTGECERALPGHADCDPSQCCRQPADTGALCVTLVKKPKVPPLTSCCLLLFDGSCSARPLSVGAQCQIIACIEPSAHNGRTEAGGCGLSSLWASGSCMLDLAHTVEPVPSVP